MFHWVYFLHANSDDRPTRLLNVLGQIAMLLGDTKLYVLSALQAWHDQKRTTEDGSFITVSLPTILRCLPYTHTYTHKQTRLPPTHQQTRTRRAQAIATKIDKPSSATGLGDVRRDGKSTP